MFTLVWTMSVMLWMVQQEIVQAGQVGFGGSFWWGPEVYGERFEARDIERDGGLGDIAGMAFEGALIDSAVVIARLPEFIPVGPGQKTARGRPGPGPRGSRPGRVGNPDHAADVARNNAQASGPLSPRAVGNRVPDGVGAPGQAVEIRGQSVDPGPGGRVIVESERFRQSGQMVGEGRSQIRDVRAADPNATIVVTDPANPTAPPVVFPPGTQPQRRGRLPRGAPQIVPVPD